MSARFTHGAAALASVLQLWVSWTGRLPTGPRALRGAAPFRDALTTVGSLLAHLYLMRRLLESWIPWIAVDVICVPLYASPGLYITSAP